MESLISIGRFSQLTGLTIKALRLYDRLGLLRPAVVDFPSGFRYYSLEQIAQQGVTVFCLPLRSKSATEKARTSRIAWQPLA